MVFTETELAGAFIIDHTRQQDDRGLFARLFCQQEFAAHGRQSRVAQANIGANQRRGTVRGMHFKFTPAAETKYVRCVRGAVVNSYCRSAAGVRRPICGTARLSFPPATSAGFTYPSASRMAIGRWRTIPTPYT